MEKCKLSMNSSIICHSDKNIFQNVPDLSFTLARTPGIFMKWFISCHTSVQWHHLNSCSVRCINSCPLPIMEASNQVPTEFLTSLRWRDLVNLKSRAPSIVLGSVCSAEIAEPGNQFLKSCSLWNWEQCSLVSPCFKRALVKHVRWVCAPWAGVVWEGSVVLLMRSGTWDGSDITNNEPGRQEDTFSSSSDTEAFAAGEELLTGTNVQIEVLEMTTQNVDRGQLCLYCIVTCTKEQRNEFQVCSSHHLSVDDPR